MRRIKEYKTQIKKIIQQNSFVESLANKHILITGATGMVGTCLIDLLMELNREKQTKIHIVAVARNEERLKATFTEYLSDAHFSYFIQDINEGVLQWNDTPVDILIHAASNTHPVAYATDPIGTIQTNVIGLKNLLDYAVEKKVERVVFLSSVEVYGENRGDAERFSEDYCGYLDCNTLRAGYPEGKRLGEALCQAYRKQYGLNIVIPRLSRLYGPTMLLTDTKAISQFIKKAAKGEDIILKSEGNQLYSYTYVVDAVAGILHILCKGKDGEAYNISDQNSEITLKKLAGILAEIAHTNLRFELPDSEEKKGYSTATKALLDSGKLQKLGWIPNTDIQSGLETTVHSIQ